MPLLVLVTEPTVLFVLVSLYFIPFNMSRFNFHLKLCTVMWNSFDLVTIIISMNPTKV